MTSRTWNGVLMMRTARVATIAGQAPPSSIEGMQMSTGPVAKRDIAERTAKRGATTIAMSVGEQGPK
jgi:hypothetical protein